MSESEEEREEREERDRDYFSWSWWSRRIGEESPMVRAFYEWGHDYPAGKAPESIKSLVEAELLKVAADLGKPREAHEGIRVLRPMNDWTVMVEPLKGSLRVTLPDGTKISMPPGARLTVEEIAP